MIKAVDHHTLRLSATASATAYYTQEYLTSAIIDLWKGGLFRRGSQIIFDMHRGLESVFVDKLSLTLDAQIFFTHLLR